MPDLDIRRPSPWWIAVGVLVVGGIAWAVGSSGGRFTDPAQAATQSSLAAHAEASGLPGTDLTLEVEAFWRAMGSGDHDAVAGALDEEGGTVLTHYAAFATEFAAGFEPENCRAVADDAIRCTLRATNPALIDLYWSGSDTTGYVTSAAVTLSEHGIDSFQLPGVVNAASVRLFAHAGETTGIPVECDRLHHDALELPPFNTAMAQTGACARALISLIPDALATEGG